MRVRIAKSIEDGVLAQVATANSDGGLGLDAALVDIYVELRRLAEWHLRDHPGSTLQATVLVHEAYLRLASSKAAKRGWESREHFFNAAALAMRRAVLDWARTKRSRRAASAEAELAELVQIPVTGEFGDEQLEAVELAIEELEAKHPRWAAAVVHRWYLGMTIDQTAEMLGVSSRTVSEDSRFVQAWIRVRVQELLGER